MPCVRRRDRCTDGAPLPLDIARSSFELLVTGVHPLSLDCRGLNGLPNRCVPLDELLDRLLHGHCPQRAKDAVWIMLVERSRTIGATWTLACAGMALPALASVARRLTARYAGDPHDVHAEVLSGFLSALSTVDLDRPRVVVRLKWAAYRRGFAALAEAVDAPTPVGPGGFESAPPQAPWGHPDLVLARAVRMGVLNRTEADLIGGTRLDGQSVGDWALGHGRTLSSVYKTRRRAEQRLVAFLRDRIRTADAEDPVARMATVDLPRGLAAPRRRGSAGCPNASPEPVSSGAGAPS
ncbi:hypothetical protein [Streptomyces sp. AN091965]|uniref:hypothetical protein n=1 Tax=Streptomyces sp. AN091965 TaxID=2927803 RepID=UPI001F61B819|nr:hypothetical protein [Streptomyces sp. AN091965]MCI3928799.1 hypothetical protein [Streptomyces sp. AN091965]